MDTISAGRALSGSGTVIKNLAKQGTTPAVPPAATPRSLPGGSYTEGDFYGSPPLRKPGLKPAGN